MLEILVVVTTIVVWIGMANMSDALERLRTEVAENSSAVESALTLINGLSFRLREALMSEDMESEISALADELDANNVKLATGVAENTAAAEDSDSFYDPTPVGEGFEESEAPVSDTEDPGAGVDEEVEADEEQVTGDTESLPSGNVLAGEGAVSDDSAVDTSATTDTPTYGNGEGSEESAS